jgi:predicted CXXCH cytochrome family protein
MRRTWRANIGFIQIHSANRQSSPELSRHRFAVLHISIIAICALNAFMFFAGGCDKHEEHANTEIGYTHPPSTDGTGQVQTVSQLSTSVEHESGYTEISPPDMTLHNFSASCSTTGCHQQLSQTRWVHAPVASGSCSACHTPIGDSAAHEFEPLPTDASACQSCHTVEVTVAVFHEPFAMGACTDCHDPHGGESKNYIVTNTPQALCITCHEEVSNSYEHHPVVQGDCLNCHSPHESNHEHLLTLNQDQICRTCHDEQDYIVGPSVFEVEGQIEFVHEPILEGACKSCHLSHGGENPAMLVDNQRSVCLSCHEEIIHDQSQALSIHSAFEDDQSCTQCHHPHASEHAGLLHESSSKLCLSCHDESIELPTGAQIPNMKEMIESSAFVHEPTRLGECIVCHTPHLSTQRSLLRIKYPNKDFTEFDSGTYAMCTGCHGSEMIEDKFTTETDFREGDLNLHFVHINREKGRACDVCHQPHASAQPKLMREFFPFGPGGWDLPIGFTISNTGGTCISACHDERLYDNTYSSGILQIKP